MQIGLSAEQLHKTGRYEFDSLAPNERTKIIMTRGRVQDIPAAITLARDAIGVDIASPQVVKRVLLRNPNNILMFRRGNQLAGTWSNLLLNSYGLESLLLGELDLTNPPDAALATVGEAPAGIYVWAVVAPGRAAEGIKHVAQFLSQPLYANANLYARPATQQGANLSDTLGFKPVAGHIDGIWRYLRHANRPSRFASAA